MSKLVASRDGARIALVEDARVVIADVDRMKACVELGIVGGLAQNDVAFAGDRVCVLSRTSTSATLHVVAPSTPQGPTKLGEISIRSPARIAAVAGDAVLVATSTTCAVVSADTIKLAPLPMRGALAVAGRLGDDDFIVATGGALEQWQASSRLPGRRFRFDHKLDPLHVGGNAQRVWVSSREQRDHIDVLALGTRSAKRVTLPEPIATLDVHANGDLLLVIGATTRRPFVVDLARSESVAALALPVLGDAVWLGDGKSIAYLTRSGALELVDLAGNEATTDVTNELTKKATYEVTTRPRREPPRDAEPEDLRERLAAWRERNKNTATRSTSRA